MKFVVNTQYMRARRRQCCLSQEELAVRCNVRRATICDIEKGKSIPRVDTLAMIAFVLGVSLDDLVDATWADGSAA